ncbi:hypothetical protein WISP_66288 [Willisornis vidua]|uniref:Uncharacterized protein n=1 Tax=Willisornis vidua TaxID=1566151 RepID=A0ABQ9DBN5_9PASS|nr:hypothetical protein WISP_66288 [Willisornis vidua]
MCGQAPESISHLSECSELAGDEYKIQYDKLGNAVHGPCCQGGGYSTTNIITPGQVRQRLRQDLVAKERADKKRSKSIDKTLKAEKREYKQTHRLLLLGEWGGESRHGTARQAAELLQQHVPDVDREGHHRCLLFEINRNANCTDDSGLVCPRG